MTLCAATRFPCFQFHLGIKFLFEGSGSFRIDAPALNLRSLPLRTVTFHHLSQTPDLQAIESLALAGGQGSWQPCDLI